MIGNSIKNINGTKFKTYDLDTIDTFKARVASKLNTLPEYLYFIEGDTNLDEKTNIIVEDFLEKIKESANKNNSLIDLIKNILIKNKNFNIKDNILPYWFAYNTILNKKYKNQGESVLQNIINDLVSNNIKNIFIYTIKELCKNNEVNKKKIEEGIKHNKKITDEKKDIFKIFTETNILQFTPFKTEYIISTLVLKSKNIKDKLSLLELFNDSILTSYVPFITTLKFYKILQDFIPSDDWIKTSDDSLILKVSFLVNPILYSKNYTDTIIKIDKETSDITAEIIVYASNEQNVSKDEYTKRFLNIFKNLNLHVEESKESKVSGIFYFPNKKINKYIFSDLVMNDELFSSLLKIDEHEGATKKKTYLFIQFYHPTTGFIKANISSKIVNKNTFDVTDTILFPDKSFYISVKVKEAINTKSILIFQNMIGKLLTLYDKKAIDVIKFYSQYIPTFGDDDDYQEEEEQEEEKKITDIAPEIFVSNYTRNCPHIRMPIIISEEEAERVDKSVIKFPRDIPTDQTAVKFLNDGEKQHYYVCNNKQYKYVGLTKNRLKNSDKFPYVPCCFKHEQNNKPKYLNYYEGKELNTSSKIKQQDIIKTNKILDNNRFGSIPNNIENFFTFIYSNQTYEYIRKGVFKNENSFLNCVMEALDSSTHILSITDEIEREAILIDTRNKLATKYLAVLCRQEMYDKTVDEIIDILKNPDAYLDPKLFIHLIEEYFECNIFIFTKTNILNDGEMILPRHLQAYYKYKNNYPCVYIYEHINEKQCELIIKYNTVKEEESQYLFTYKEAKNIRNIFSKLKQSYTMDKLIKNTIMPIPVHKNLKIISQWIDSYGKTRRLNIKFNENMISLITSPTPPIKIIETKTQIIHKINIDIAMDFIKELDIQLESQTIVNNMAHELNGTLGNVKVSIPIKETNKIDNIKQKEEDLSFTTNKISILDEYNKNKKIARYLIEYTLWMYSKYLYNNKKSITNDSITTFSKNYFKIDPNFKYGYVSKEFKINNLLMDDGLIVVHDIDTLKRLIYVLRLNIQRNIENIIKYHTKIFIQNYYVDITDFTQHPNQVVLFGEESIENLINENNFKYTLHNNIQIGHNIPYFFKNILVNNQVYLAQNTSSLEKAFDISLTWIKKSYNKGIFAVPIKPGSFTLYSYKNEYDITKYEIDTNKPKQNIIIVGYKIENKSYYTSLLNLS